MDTMDFSYNLRQGFYVNITTVGTDGNSIARVGSLRVYSWDDMSDFIKNLDLRDDCDHNMPMHVHAERRLFLSGLNEKDNHNPFYSVDLKDTSNENQQKSHVIDFWVVGEKVPTFGELKKSAVFCVNKHGCEECEHKKCLFDMDVRKDKLPAVVDYTIPGNIRLLNQNNIVIQKSTGAQLHKEVQTVSKRLVDFFNANITFNINQSWLNINR